MAAYADRANFDFACPDWFDRLQAGRTPMPDLPLNEKEAARGVGIFDKLCLPDVEGRPLNRDAAGDWQRDLVAALAGSVFDGERRVRELFVMVPKKNSKTTGGSAIALTLLLMNRRPMAEFIYAGPTQEVANIAFRQTAGMIAADPHLRDRFHVQEHKSTIVDRTNQAFLKIKTFDMSVMTGAKPVFVLLDELHLMAAIANAARILGQIRGGLAPNPEGVLVIITTQSDVPPAGVFKAELTYARRVRDGHVQGSSMLPVLYEFPLAVQADEAKPWRDPSTWHVVLPNLGRSITLPRLVEQYEQAREKGDAEERLWVSQHLNIEIGIALHGDGWEGAPLWQDAADPEPITLESMIERCDVVTVGGDGGGLDDLLGLCVCGRDRTTRDWLMWFRAWAHPIALKRRKSNAESYAQFVADGDLVVCSEPTQDIREFVEICARLNAEGLLPDEAAIGLDPVGVAAIVQELGDAGIGERQMVGVPQGYKLSGVIKGMARKLNDGRLWHDGSAMMTWVVSNARAEQRGNATLVTKQVSGTAKIDPLIAGYNAFSLMERNPQAGDRTGSEDDYFAALEARP